TVGVRGPAGRRETESSFGLVRFEMSKTRTVFRASGAWGLTVGDRRLRASAKSLAIRRLRSSRRETPCGLAQEGTGSAGMLAQEDGSFSGCASAAGISARVFPSGPR